MESVDRSHAMPDLAWPDVDRQREQNALVLIPLSQIVQHGPHLPVSTDVLQADAVCRQAAAWLVANDVPAVVGPPVPYGHSPLHETFPGSVSLSPETLCALLVDYIASLARQGFKRYLVVMVAPGSWPSVELCAYRVRERRLGDLYVFDGLAALRAAWDEQHPAGSDGDLHAGEFETSIMLAIEPQLVDMTKAVDHASRELEAVKRLPPVGATVNRRMLCAGLWDWRIFGPDGVIGPATRANAESGQRALEAATAGLGRFALACIATASPP